MLKSRESYMEARLQRIALSRRYEWLEIMIDSALDKMEKCFVSLEDLRRYFKGSYLDIEAELNDRHGFIVKNGNVYANFNEVCRIWKECYDKYGLSEELKRSIWNCWMNTHKKSLNSL